MEEKNHPLLIFYNIVRREQPKSILRNAIINFFIVKKIYK